MDFVLVGSDHSRPAAVDAIDQNITAVGMSVLAAVIYRGLRRALDTLLD